MMPTIAAQITARKAELRRERDLLPGGDRMVEGFGYRIAELERLERSLGIDPGKEPGRTMPIRQYIVERREVLNSPGYRRQSSRDDRLDEVEKMERAVLGVHQPRVAEPPVPGDIHWREANPAMMLIPVSHFEVLERIAKALEAQAPLVPIESRVGRLDERVRSLEGGRVDHAGRLTGLDQQFHYLEGKEASDAEQIALHGRGLAIHTDRLTALEETVRRLVEQHQADRS